MPKSEQLLASQMPLRSIPVDAEMVLQGSGTGAIFVMSQESLGAEQASRKIFVCEHLIFKWNDVSRAVKSFPSSSANKFNLNAASDAIQFHWRVEFSDGKRIGIGEGVGTRMGTTSVNNCTEDVLIVGSSSLEVDIISLNTTLKTEKILMAKLV